MIVSCTFPVQQCFLMSYFSILALSGGNVFELCVSLCIFSCISWAVCSLVLPASNSPSTEAKTAFSKSALQGVKGAVHCTSWAEPAWVSICNVRLLLKLTGLRCCTSANLLCCPLLPQLWVGTDRGQSCLWVALSYQFPQLLCTSREFRVHDGCNTSWIWGLSESETFMCGCKLFKVTFQCLRGYVGSNAFVSGVDFSAVIQYHMHNTHEYIPTNLVELWGLESHFPSPASQVCMALTLVVP